MASISTVWHQYLGLHRLSAGRHARGWYLKCSSCYRLHASIPFLQRLMLARYPQCYSDTGCSCLTWLLVGLWLWSQAFMDAHLQNKNGSAVVLQPSSRGFEAWLQLEEANGWDLECLLKLDSRMQSNSDCYKRSGMLKQPVWHLSRCWAHVGVPGSQTPTSFPTLCGDYACT